MFDEEGLTQAEAEQIREGDVVDGGDPVAEQAVEEQPQAVAAPVVQDDEMVAQAEPQEQAIGRRVGLYISLDDIARHLDRRPDAPEGTPVYALVIEGVCEVMWPAGVTWLEAVRYGLTGK